MTANRVGPDAAVVVPAAGQGTRMGGGTPKQLRDLGGEPVLVRTLRRFDKHPAVGALVVAASADALGEVDALLRGAGFATPVVVVAGGSSRRASVERALDAVPDALDLVLVHDAVRPFVTRELLDAVLTATRADGAAVPAIPVADTLRRAERGLFGETVPRDGLYLVQTPQGFRRAVLAAAYAASDSDTTDDAALVAATGYAVRLVPGDRRNLKLTTPDDWALAEALLNVEREARGLQG